MKLRVLYLAAAAAIATVAAGALVFAPAPPSHATRKLAVIHIRIRPASPRSSQPAAGPAMLHAPQEQVLPPPSLARPAPTARPLRPLFPWWFRRRHVAAPQPTIA